MRPTESVVRGVDGSASAARRAAAAAAACTAFGTPNAAQEWPPGPAYETRKRREPSARWMMRSSPAPSSAITRERRGRGVAK